MTSKTFVRCLTIILAGFLLLAGYFIQQRWRINSAIASLKNDDPDVRAQAAATLAQIGAKDKAVVPSLIEALIDEKYSSLSVANALLQIGPAAIPQLIQVLNDEDARLRHWGAQTSGETWETPRLFWALRKLKTDPAVEAGLNEALKDEDRHVRSSAAYALGEYNVEFDGHKYQVTTPAREGSHEKQLSHWMTNLKHNDALVRTWSADHLGEMGIEAKVAIPALNEALKDDDARVRRVASWALKQIDWINDLKDEDAKIRAHTCIRLGQMAEDARSALPELMELLQDEDDFVRFSASWAVKSVDPEVPMETGSK